MAYDYGGFPPHTYRIQYPAPGDPALAERARELIVGAGLDVATDDRRGFDHGVFVPLALMYPDAHMPIVMVSIKTGYDPEQHLALGRALAPLRDDSVLVIGSGLTYHNMRGFNQDRAAGDAETFTRYLDDTVALGEPSLRDAQLRDWAQAPARTACPSSRRPSHAAPGRRGRGRPGHGTRSFCRDRDEGADDLVCLWRHRRSVKPVRRSTPGSRL